MSNTAVATKALIRHGNALVATNNPTTHGNEELLLTVAVVRRGSTLTAMVDGTPRPRAVQQSSDKTVEEVASELFCKIARERGYKIK